MNKREQLEQAKQNYFQMRENYYNGLDQIILQKLKGEVRVEWKEIAKDYGITYTYFYMRRVNRYPEYNQDFRRKDEKSA